MLRMNAVVFCCSLVLCVSQAFSISVLKPSIQRKAIGESCTFRWNLTEAIKAYSGRLLSNGSSLALGSNVYISYVSRSNGPGVITMFIWNIQISNAGNYSLSISTDGMSSTDVNSDAVLFVYTFPQTQTILAVGRNPVADGDYLELNCSANSNSLPVEYRSKMYYYWKRVWFGDFRYATNGPAVLKNGDAVPGYSFKNDGQTLVIASAEATYSEFACAVQEEGSPFISDFFYSPPLIIYGKPYIYGFIPASQTYSTAIYSYVNISFYCRANPPLTLFTDWTFVSDSEGTRKYRTAVEHLTADIFSLSIYLNSPSSYGNYSLTVTNRYGSKTATFQVRFPGRPDNPSDFSVQYVTHSLLSLQWRCKWYNGYKQLVVIRLREIVTNLEVETQAVSLDEQCYNSAFETLFESNIQPETAYEASIWSSNTAGANNAVSLVVRTPKRLIFDISPANISVIETQATIDFCIVDSTKAVLWLNVICCVELTTQCTNRTYLIASTDSQIVYDNLPTGTEFVFDFIVYDTDGYTYTYTLAFVKGVRVSTEVTTPATSIPYDITTRETSVPYSITTPTSSVPHDITTPTSSVPHDITSVPCVFSGTVQSNNGNPLFATVSQLKTMMLLEFMLAALILVLRQ